MKPVTQQPIPKDTSCERILRGKKGRDVGL